MFEIAGIPWTAEKIIFALRQDAKLRTQEPKGDLSLFREAFFGHADYLPCRAEITRTVRRDYIALRRKNGPIPPYIVHALQGIMAARS